MFLKTTLSRTMAGACAACAVGALAIGVALATPGVLITSTTIAGPSMLEDVHLDSKSDINDVKIKTKGFSDVYVVKNVISPGGNTGWHSHPGSSIISVVSGQATEYRSDEPGEAVVHATGTAFADEGGDHAHLIANEGTTDLVLVAFQVIPLGANRRIDKPAP